MDARPVAVAAGVVLAALLFVWLERDLVRHNAGATMVGLAAAAYAAMALAWLAVFVARVPTPIAWVATGLALIVTVGHRSLGATVAGRSPNQRLAGDVGAIRQGLSTLTTSRYERARLRTRARELDRWRQVDEPDEIVEQLVDLVQQEVADRLDAEPGNLEHAERESQRAARIHELIARLQER